MHPEFAGQVRVQINQSGQQRRIAEVNDFGARRDRQLRGDFGDALAFDAHHRWSERRAAAPVNQASGFDDDYRFRNGRLAGSRNEEAEEDDDGSSCLFSHRGFELRSVCT